MRRTFTAAGSKKSALGITLVLLGSLVGARVGAAQQPPAPPALPQVVESGPQRPVASAARPSPEATFAGTRRAGDSTASSPHSPGAAGSDR